MEPEDSQTVFNLHEARTSPNVTKFDVFWEEATKFIQEDVGAAIDDRRHTTCSHPPCQSNIRDFREQARARVPDGIPTCIPSEEWLRLQFWPKSRKTRTGCSHPPCQGNTYSRFSGTSKGSSTRWHTYMYSK